MNELNKLTTAELKSLIDLEKSDGYALLLRMLSKYQDSVLSPRIENKLPTDPSGNFSHLDFMNMGMDKADSFRITYLRQLVEKARKALVSKEAIK